LARELGKGALDSINNRGLPSFQKKGAEGKSTVSFEKGGDENADENSGDYKTREKLGFIGMAKLGIRV